jgi:hypothetical protein
MPEQYITIRAYLNTADGKSTYMREVMEEIQSIWEALVVMYGAVSITRISNREVQVTSGAGATKWCTEMKMRLVCSTDVLVRVMRLPQSYFRRCLAGTTNEVLTFLVWSLETEEVSNLQRPLELM